MIQSNSMLSTFYHLLVPSLGLASNGGQLNCTTPRGVAGQCIELRQCPQLYAISQTRPIKTEDTDYLRESHCGFIGKEPQACCPIQNENPDLSKNALLPSECGRQLSQRIVDGERTGIDEFPWLALLIYSTPNGDKASCGGALINHRYVLTAAHCLKGKKIPPTWSLDKVRLGEYDTTTNPDCVKNDANVEVCADDAITAGIEKRIAHENYKPLDRAHQYDIALLRLDRDVPFTNYIRPICLPSSDDISNELFVAGWGETESEFSSNIKLKVSVPFVDRQQCQKTYYKVRILLGFGQICAGGVQRNDSCIGDSGGPLMSEEKESDGTSRWTAVGVASFGPKPCDFQNWPSVYSKVIDFIPWILSKLEP